jgi:hypothetical protein
MALAIKLGELKPAYSKKAAEMAASMTEKQLKDYCQE